MLNGGGVHGFSFARGDCPTNLGRLTTFLGLGHTLPTPGFALLICLQFAGLADNEPHDGSRVFTFPVHILCIMSNCSSMCLPVPHVFGCFECLINMLMMLAFLRSPSSVFHHLSVSC